MLSRRDEALSILEESRAHAAAAGNIHVVAISDFQIARALALRDLERASPWLRNGLGEQNRETLAAEALLAWGRLGL